MERKITHLQVGDAKYNVGTNGVKAIGVDFVHEISDPICSVDYGDHIWSIVGDVRWRHEEELIKVPKLVLDGETS